jgi:glycosyltransferase involved in cell wall biosynthesis
MQPKRILIFSLAYYPIEGGAEIAVKEITNRLQGFEFDMVTMLFDESPLEEKVGNVNVHRIKSTKSTFPVDALIYARKLHMERRYDAIWAIMAARAGAAALFFKHSFPEIPYILTLQEGDPVWYMKLRSLYYINPFFRKIFSRADKAQAISNYLADYAQAMGYKGEVEVIPNGVDIGIFQKEYGNKESLRQELGFSSSDTLLITTSRLVTKNRTGDIIESLKFLPEEVKLVIIGSGKLEERLKEVAEDTGVAGRVRFLGHMPYEEIPQYLQASDIFVRPSISEGFGNSFVEAMAAGLPVIGTAVGGIVDFLKDGETGLVCEVKNPESIAEQVKRLMDDKELREKIVTNGRGLAEEKYDWDLIASQMRSRVFAIA